MTHSQSVRLQGLSCEKNQMILIETKDKEIAQQPHPLQVRWAASQLK